MTEEKKKVRIESVPNEPRVGQGIKVAPPLDPIKEVEPIGPKRREYKQAPPPDPPDQENPSDSEA